MRYARAQGGSGKLARRPDGRHSAGFVSWKPMTASHLEQRPGRHRRVRLEGGPGRPPWAKGTGFETSGMDASSGSAISPRVEMHAGDGVRHLQPGRVADTVRATDAEK